MQKTTNYGLPQWGADDQIRMDDFNAAFASLDAALRSHDTADENALAAVSAEASARAAALAALANNVGTVGHNCRVKWGTYTGSGTYGAAALNTLACGFTPVLAIVCEPATKYSVASPFVLFRPYAEQAVSRSASTNTVEYLHLTWGDAALSWYNESKPAYQFNSEGTVYSYVIFGYDRSAGEA